MRHNKSKHQPKITVLICTLNEAANLPWVLTKIPSFVDKVLLVDGHSTDDTVAVAQRLRPDIEVLYQPGKGKGDALRYGIKNAKGDIIVTLDADGSSDPEEMSQFIEPLLNGYDFAKGSRFLHSRPNMAWHRRFGNWLLVTLANILYGTRYTDLTSGYNAIWNKAFEELKLPTEVFLDEPMLNIRAKKARLKIVEIPCRDSGRISGTGKNHTIRQGWRILKTILRERFSG